MCPDIQSCSMLPSCRSRFRRLPSAVEHVVGRWCSLESSRTDWWILEHIARCQFLHRKGRVAWKYELVTCQGRRYGRRSSTFKDTRVQVTKSLMFSSSGTFASSENVHFYLTFYLTSPKNLSYFQTCIFKSVSASVMCCSNCIMLR